MVGDVTLAALARLGKLTEIVAEPWTRAQASVARGRNMLIIPLSRRPEREELYTLIAPVMELERAFFSLDEPVTSFAEARQRYRHIGVGLGTAQVAILQREGFRDEQIVQLTLGENPVHLLNLGRIDAWFTGVPEALYIWEGLNYRQQNLRRSPTLASTGLYLSCRRNTMRDWSKTCAAPSPNSNRKVSASACVRPICRCSLILDDLAACQALFFPRSVKYPAAPDLLATAPARSPPASVPAPNHRLQHFSLQRAAPQGQQLPQVQAVRWPGCRDAA